MKSFSAPDYAVFIGYLLAIAAFGSSFYRRRTTAKEYFLGGRSMSWLPAGISIIAADLSAITVMGTPAWSYAHNYELLWNSFGYPIVAPLVILIFVPFYAKLNLYTAYEYLERRFSLLLRLLMSLLFQILRGSHIAIVIYAPSLVINLVMGLPVWQCIIFIGGFTTLYTTLGGIKAVIWTDVIQFSVVISGVVLVLWHTLAHIDGGLAAAFHIAGEAGRLKLFNFSTDPAELTSFWACIIGGAVLAMAPLTTDQAILQRLFTTKSVKDCRQSVMLQALVIIPLSLLLYAVGTGLFVFYKLHPERLAGLNSADAILPLFAVRELPAGLSGLIIAAIFAASMAVMSAGINSLTTATVIDFYQRIFRPGETAVHYAKAGRIGTLCWGAAVTVVAMFAERLGALALAYSRVASIVTGPVLGVFLLGTLTHRTNAQGALLGTLAGMAVVLIVTFQTNWSFFYLGPIGTACTFVLGYLGSYMAPAPLQAQIKGLTK